MLFCQHVVHYNAATVLPQDTVQKIDGDTFAQLPSIELSGISRSASCADSLSAPAHMWSGPCLPVSLNSPPLPCVVGCYALYPGGCKRYLLSTLASNPAVRTEWFWASTFGFAVSCSYLNAEEFVNIKAVVTRCLQQFAGYLAGVGIPGEEI